MAEISYFRLNTERINFNEEEMKRRLNNCHDLSDLLVNEKGQLCEVIKLAGNEYVHVFNYLKKDNWSGITFSFDNKYVSKRNKW